MALRHDKKLAFIHINKTAGVAVVTNFKMDIEGNHNTYEYYKINYPGYLTFAIVRNPYDRLVSAFEFMKYYDKANPAKSKYQNYYKNGFTHFCHTINKSELLLKPQHEFICNKNGNLMIDKLFYFEDNFWESLYELFNEVVEPKIYNKTERKPYPDYYTIETIELVYDNYKTDFKLFNYTK